VAAASDQVPDLVTTLDGQGVDVTAPPTVITMRTQRGVHRDEPLELRRQGKCWQ
jgi:hypothetical protein